MNKNIIAICVLQKVIIRIIAFIVIIISMMMMKI